MRTAVSPRRWLKRAVSTRFGTSERRSTAYCSESGLASRMRLHPGPQAGERGIAGGVQEGEVDGLHVARGRELLARPLAADLMRLARRVEAGDAGERRLDPVEAVDPQNLFVEILGIDLVRRLGAGLEVVVAPGGDGDVPEGLAALLDARNPGRSTSARTLRDRSWPRRRRRASRGRAGPGGSRNARSARPRRRRAPSLPPPRRSGRPPGPRRRRSIPGSAPRSKRWLASVCMPSRRAAERTRLRSKWAPSIRMSRVASVTSLSRPAHDAAQADGDFRVGDHQHARDRARARRRRASSGARPPVPGAPRGCRRRAWPGRRRGAAGPAPRG